MHQCTVCNDCMSDKIQNRRSCGGLSAPQVDVQQLREEHFVLSFVYNGHVVGYSLHQVSELLSCHLVWLRRAGLSDGLEATDLVDELVVQFGA
jgi:hypothetical protein